MGKRRDWTSWVGYAIFILALAGGPILRAIQSATGIPVPGFTLPVIIAALMLVSAAVSIRRSVAGRPRSDLDPNTSEGAGPINAPMPPFRGEGPSIFTPPPRQSTGQTPQAMPPPVQMPGQTQIPPPYAGAPQTPRFEPVINPLFVLIGIVGVFAILAIGWFVFGGSP
jgi:hypothetical protein